VSIKIDNPKKLAT